MLKCPKTLSIYAKDKNPIFCPEEEQFIYLSFYCDETGDIVELSYHFMDKSKELKEKQLKLLEKKSQEKEVKLFYDTP